MFNVGVTAGMLYWLYEACNKICKTILLHKGVLTNDRQLITTVILIMNLLLNKYAQNFSILHKFPALE